MSSTFGIGSFATIELALLLGPVVRGFRAEARIEKDRTDDIRRAEAGYVSGEVVPSIAQLFEAIGDLLPPRAPKPEVIRRAALTVGVRVDDLTSALSPDDAPDPQAAIADALIHGSITTRLNAVIDASARSQSVRKAEKGLVLAWTRLAYVCLATQVAGAAAFLNGLTGSSVLPHPLVILTRVLFGVFGIGTLIAVVLVRQAEQTFARTVRGGKDASGQQT